MLKFSEKHSHFILTQEEIESPRSILEIECINQKFQQRKLQANMKPLGSFKEEIQF